MNFVFQNALLLFAPIPILIVYGRIQVRLKRAKAARNAEADTKPKPFDPQPEPTPNIFLRRFAPMDRHYLRQQLPIARVGFYIVGWVVFAITAGSLLPGDINRLGVTDPLPQRVWFSFMLSTQVLTFGCLAIVLFTAIFACSGVVSKEPSTLFYRTRPLPHKRLFWGRVLPALLTMLSANGAAILLAFLLLFLLHGPVWSNFGPTLHMRALFMQAVRHQWLFQSPARVFVSIATSMLLVFSLMVLLISLPTRGMQLPKFLLMAGPAAGVATFQTLPNGTFSKLERFGLAPVASTPAPPWLMYLLPLTLSVGLLLLAQFFASRKEN